jgi:hypothetical protein
MTTGMTDRNSKRSAVMRVCTTGGGSGSELGAGGPGNEAGGGEMEYDGREAGMEWAPSRRVDVASKGQALGN